MRAQSISMGGDAACGLAADRHLYCWGTLPLSGLSSTNAVSTARPLGGGLSVATVNPPCVVTTEGAGYCWGDNSAGQFGNGTVQSASFDAPAPAGGAFKWREIFRGGAQACGVTTTDEGFCWGGFGVLESLGIGSDLSLFQRCGRGLCRLTPAPVVPASAYAEIRPQPEVQLYTCALLRDASIACAGVTGFFSPVAPSGLTASFIPVVGLPPARQLVVGSTQPCIVSTSDEGWCAGSFSGNVSHAPARIRPDLKPGHRPGRDVRYCDRWPDVLLERP
jgi:hypothetical protein